MAKADDLVEAQLHDLIQQGERVIATAASKPSGWGGVIKLVDSALAIKWRTSCNNFLARVAGKDSIYHFNFRSNNSTEPDNVKQSLAVMIAFKEDMEAGFLIFEENLEQGVISVETDPTKIFIGHGHDSSWRDLKDHLHEQHDFDVIAYEIGPRAGLSVKEILDSMLNESSLALLVLTGEDMDSYGKMHARENVIHELGLFQGRLGFQRAIALLEQDVSEFSNILGINQIRFSKGNIRETFGDVLATIRREFSEDAE